MDSSSKVKQAWRFIPDGFSSPFSNMATDEVLLEFYSAGKIKPTFRVYGWSPGGFSLGYFQNARDVLNIDKCQREDVPFVRRMTGGSVIYHKGDISYSLVCSRKDLGIKGSLLDSYKIVSSFLIRFYRRLGLEVEFAGSKSRTAGEGFCSQAREIYDIVIEGRKIGGSAQRRRRDILFQHGSIPLQNSFQLAAEFSKSGPGKMGPVSISLDEVLGRVLDYRPAEQLLKDAFQETFNVEFEEDYLSYYEDKMRIELVKNKYSRPEWNLERNNYAPALKKTFLAE